MTVSDGHWAQLVCPECRARGPKVSAKRWQEAKLRAIERGWRVWARPGGLRSRWVCPDCVRDKREQGAA